MVSSSPDQLERSLAGLRSLAMLRGCDEAGLQQLAALVTTVTVPAGRMLIREGDVDHVTYLIIDGWASVTCADRTISLGVGQFVGEMAHLNDGVRSATVVATTTMELLAIQPECFEAFVGRPRIALRLAESLAWRLRLAQGSPLT